MCARGSAPPVTAQVVETFEMAGYDVVKLVLYPVQWLPQQRTLIFHSLLSVSIAYQGGAMPQGPVSYPDQMQTEEIRSIVVNQEFIPPLTAMKTPEELDAYYLIITDNYLWRASFIERDVAVDGDMVAEFQRLADWKTEKGLKAAVVTVSDIVEGRYGNFKKNAAGWPVRDLRCNLTSYASSPGRGAAACHGRGSCGTGTGTP